MFKICFQAKRVRDIGNEGENEETVKQYIKPLYVNLLLLIIIVMKEYKSFGESIKVNER